MASIQCLHRPPALRVRSLTAVCSKSIRAHTRAQATDVQLRSLHTRTVTDEDIASLAAKPLHPIALSDLVKHGRPPLSAEALFKSANFTLSILPSRLAHRIQSLRNLPFIVVSNPQISRMHGNYMHSLSTLLPWAEKEISSLEDEAKFTEVMADLVQTHANTIGILARGFLEARRYISPQVVTGFLDEHLRARIGTRLIAEQHLALHFSSQPHREVIDGPEDDSDHSDFIGVIHTKCRPTSIIRHCEGTVSDICELKYGVRPSIIINGEPDYTFAHIPVHLEYIITELLKNAFRATVEKGMERERIEVTIAPLPEAQVLGDDDPSVTNAKQGAKNVAMRDSSQPDISSSHPPPQSEDIRPLHTSTPGVTIRIRDRGGGISPENLSQIWDYSFTTFDEEKLARDTASENGVDGLSAISAAGVDDKHSLAGLGYGLPLGRAYAEYFGGGIAVQSLWGWGTDVYLSLRGLGKVD